jgi:hypothetical protein
MDAGLQQVERAGLAHGSSFDLDFHSVPANSAAEPLERHYVSSRRRSQKRIMVFRSRCPRKAFCATPMPVLPRASMLVRFSSLFSSGNGTPGNCPTELVFDSQLITYQKLSELNREGIFFVTLRRWRQILHRIYRQSDSAWRRISLPALTLIYRNPKKCWRNT